MANSNLIAFGTTPTEADIAEARKDLAREYPIPLERIRDDELVRIATVWACFNELRRRFSKDDIAELMVAYLGSDEVAYRYHNTSARNRR